MVSKNALMVCKNTEPVKSLDTLTGECVQTFAFKAIVVSMMTYCNRD